MTEKDMDEAIKREAAELVRKWEEIGIPVEKAAREGCLTAFINFCFKQHRLKRVGCKGLVADGLVDEELKELNPWDTLKVRALSAEIYRMYGLPPKDLDTSSSFPEPQSAEGNSGERREN